MRVGDVLFVSGHGPHHPGMDIVRRGKLGAELSVEQGYEVAKACGLSILSTLRTELGDLDRVRQVVRLMGMVNCTPDFELMPKVVDGASDPVLRAVRPRAGSPRPGRGGHGQPAPPSSPWRSAASSRCQTHDRAGRKELRFP